MEKKNTNKQANRGLIVFICIALVLAMGLGAVVYLPKVLRKNNDPDSGNEVYTTETPAPSPTAYESGTPIVVTAIPSDLPMNTDTIATEDDFGVSCSNPLATAIGMQVLRSGGNAVDAAVAVAFALGVLEPYASGIGGGGGMMVYDPSTGTSMFYDYRDAACENIHSSVTFGSIGVPGFVAGMETVQKRYGVMNWGSLIQPSIEYAENGFAISASFARHLQSSRSKLSSKNNPQFYNGANLLTEGETIYQADLAETYRLIQRYGSSVFYNGAITEHIIANSKLTQEDFDNYSVREREPVTGTFKGCTIVSAPAPFSGTTLIQMLEIAEALDVKSYESDVLRYAELMASIASVTLKDRRKSICDPEYHPVPNNLLAEAHINRLIEKVKAGNPEYIEPDDEHESTTHISIIDSNGMMVSMTNTLSDFFGFGVYVDGFFLNNTLKTSSDDTSARNYCIRGQRPRSFAMPTFIFGDDGSKIALGSSGGDRIPQVVSQIILRYFEGETLQEACDKPRLYMNGTVYRIEDSSYIDPEGLLQKNGFYKEGFSTREFFGAFNAVMVGKDGKAYGASDARRYGGFESGEVSEDDSTDS